MEVNLHNEKYLRNIPLPRNFTYLTSNNLWRIHFTSNMEPKKIPLLGTLLLCLAEVLILTNNAMAMVTNPNFSSMAPVALPSRHARNPEIIGQSFSPSEKQTPSTTPSSNPLAPGEIIISEISTNLKIHSIVYYSSMEEESQLFFNTSLAASFETLSPFVDFTFIPFFYATIIKGELYCPNSVDSKCYIDTVHACVMSQIVDKKLIYQFLACTMTGVVTVPDIAKCAKSINLELETIEKCSKSDVGLRLAWDIIEKKKAGCIRSPCFSFNDLQEARIDLTETFGDFVFMDDLACKRNYEEAVCRKLRTKNVIPPSTLKCKSTEIILVEVFYEVMNEASQAWFKALAPIYDKFGPSFDLEFVPCMSARLEKNLLMCGGNEDPDKECVGGMVHSCAIKILGTNNASALFKFLACTMQDHTKIPDFQKCASENNIDYTPIQACFDQGLGSYLCYQNSKRKNNDDPPPIITFDLAPNPQHNELAKGNVQLALCQQLKTFNLPYPDECKGSIKLTIYFYAMNPEFQIWARTTLLEMYRTFSTFVAFDLNSCRSAQIDGSELKCSNKMDHKCYADKYLACAKNQLKDDSVPLVELLLCMVQNHNGKLPNYDDCAKAVALDPMALSQCANGPDGVKFCTESFDKGPKTDHNRAFLINDNWDEAVSGSIDGNYLFEMCIQLQKANLSFPSRCFEIEPPHDEQ